MKFIIIVALLSVLISLQAEVIPQHFPPGELNRTADTTLILNLLGSFDVVEEIVFSFRQIGQLSYEEVSRNRFDITSREVLFRLPRLYPPANGYEYYFTLKKDDQIITLPANQPQNNPFRVFLPPALSTVASDFILLNPVTEVNPDQDLVFAVSFYSIESSINTGTLRLYQNGRDITNQATINPPLLVYTIRNPRAGNYHFQIRVFDLDGKQIQSPNWSYSVLSKPTFVESLPFEVRGNAVFNSNVRSLSKTSESSMHGLTDNDASFRLNLQARHEWLLFRHRLYLTSYESSSRQPLNRYSIGFTIPYFDLDLIDSTPNYGTFILSNKNIRGVSGRIHYSNVSLKSTYGQTIRAIDGKTVFNEADTLYTGGTFQRRTFASKLEFGNQELLSFGIGFAKNKDQMSSLAEQYYVSRTDTTYVVLSTPKDNFVLGSDFRLALDRQRFVMGAEIAASIYNSNIIDGVISKDSLEIYLDESFPFDPAAFESIIIINKNMEPIIPNKANLAYRIYLNWFIAGNFLNFSYSEVGASFRSLSSGYLQNDARIININDNVSLLNSQLILDAGLNIIRDNLSNQKFTTTTNTNWYLQSMLRLREYPYFRLGYNTNSFSDDLEENDIDQRMGTFNIGSGYNFTQISYATTILDIGFSLSSDKDNTGNENFDIKRNSFQVNVLNSWSEFPLVTRFSFSNASHQDKSTFGYDNRYFRSFSLRNEYAFLERTLRPYLNLKLNTFSGDQSSQLTTNYELGTLYYPFPRTTINTSLELMSYQNKDVDDLDYSKFTWKLNIAQRF